MSTIASLFNSEEKEPEELKVPGTEEQQETGQENEGQEEEGSTEGSEEESNQEEEEQEGEEGAEEGSDQGLSPEEFFSTLDQMHGADINSEIDYEGVDPLSPEGQFKRETYISQKAITDFEESLKAKDPRGYAYLLHRNSGGSDDEFFQRSSFVLPELDVLKESIDTQKEVYERILISRGNSPKQAAALVRIAAEEGELAAEAEAAWKTMKDQEKLELENAAKLTREAEERTNRDLNEFGTIINDSIISNDALRFVIPQADKVKFAEDFRSKVHYDDGKFFVVKEINKDNLPKVMESELFAFVGGNLNKLVEKKATSVSAKRTINRVRATQSTPKSQAASSGIASLGSIL